MIKINIVETIKPNLKHRLKLLKKVMIKKGWKVTNKGNIYINTKGEDDDCISYDEYEDTFKPHYSKYLNL